LIFVRHFSQTGAAVEYGRDAAQVAQRCEQRPKSQLASRIRRRAGTAKVPRSTQFLQLLRFQVYNSQRQTSRVEFSIPTRLRIFLVLG
jgi:hypothetical protein